MLVAIGRINCFMNPAIRVDLFLSDIHLDELEEMGDAAAEFTLGIVELENQFQSGEAIGVGVDGDGQTANHLVILPQILQIILVHVPAAGQAD